MGIVNMLLSLPAGRQMLALPKEQSAPLEEVMRQLREQANKKAAMAKVQGEESIVEYWRLVSTYAKYVARAFNRENLKREKTQVADDLMRAMGGAQQTRKSIAIYAGSQAFRTPLVSEKSCMLELVHASFSPWANTGDYIQVDFTAQRLTSDGLYLVAVDGKYLAIRGFHKGPAGWYVHENGSDVPQRVQMEEDRLPAGFEIVGIISDVFKKTSLGGGTQ